MEWIRNVAYAVQNLSSWLNALVSMVSDFFSDVGRILVSIGQVFEGLWYGATTLFSGIYKVFHAVIIEYNIAYYISYCFNYLVDFIGYGGVLLLGSFFVVILVRIVIAFVFRILKLNADYKKYNK